LLVDTADQPLAGATIQLRNTAISRTSETDGTFILPDIPFTGLGLVDIDPSTIVGGLPYPIVTVRQDVSGNRDNEMERTRPLEAATGPSLSVGTGSGNLSPDADEAAEAEAAQPTALTGTITTDGVTLEVPVVSTARFPNGATLGNITLTSVRNSRVPVNLPPGVFSSTIVQITPFRVRLNPGGRLTFPNRDNLPAGGTARLYKLDQTANSPTIGDFIDVGAATVSANGQTVQTQAGAIQETSYYFVGVPRQTTTVTGRVVEADGVTPVRRAHAFLRGQEAVTDGNGGFILRQVPANAGENLSVDVSVIRLVGRVDRARSAAKAAVPGGTTDVGVIRLAAFSTNQPPALLGLPLSYTVTEKNDSAFRFRVADPNPNQAIRVTAAGASFLDLSADDVRDFYVLFFAPPSGSAGRYTISVTATDSAGLSRTASFPLRVNRPPVANAQSIEVVGGTSKTITLTGSDPDQDPLNFLVVTAPKNGKLSFDGAAVIYTPSAGFVGQDVLEFKANDGYADSNNARIVLNVVQAPKPGSKP
jgi:Bacterial Ig domain